LTLDGAPFAGMSSFCSPLVVHCGSGRSLCLVIGLAGWWPSSPTTSWSERRLRRHPSPELSGAARQLAGMGARLSFGGRGIAHSAPYSAAPRAFVLKSGCCVRSLAANTMSTAAARRSSYPGSIKAVVSVLWPPGDWERMVDHRESTSVPDGLRTRHGALFGGRTVAHRKV
jgi:hypothetical protein